MQILSKNLDAKEAQKIMREKCKKAPSERKAQVILTIMKERPMVILVINSVVSANYYNYNTYHIGRYCLLFFDVNKSPGEPSLNNI